MSLKYRVKIKECPYYPRPVGKEVDATRHDKYDYFLVKGEELGSEEYYYQEQHYLFKPDELEVLEIYTGEEDEKA